MDDINKDTLMFIIGEHMANGECPPDIYNKRISDLAQAILKAIEEGKQWQH